MAKTCRYCGEEYEKRAGVGQYEDGFCAWQCKNAQYFVDIGRPLKRVARRSDKHKVWRDAVLERDQHTCQFCGERELLQVHHIVPVEDSQELRYVVENGQTLCVSCHSGVHQHFIYPFWEK